MSPPVSLPSLPSDLAGQNPCARAGSALTAASTYLGLAELGLTEQAQRCVSGDAVPSAATAALTAAGVAAFYRPSGATAGPAIAFTSGDGGTTVTITTAAAGTGFAVTAVQRG